MSVNRVFIRMLIEDYVEPATEGVFEEPIEYLKDKIITG